MTLAVIYQSCNLAKQFGSKNNNKSDKFLGEDILIWLINI